MDIFYEFSEFFRGQIDCKSGEQHKPNQSDHYDRGYSAQYELEQVQSFLGADL